MALKGRILSLTDVDMATEGTYETDVYMFKRKFEVAGLDEDTIHNMILKQVEGQKQQFIDIGLTEEEADERIEELIEIESEPLPVETVVEEE